MIAVTDTSPLNYLILLGYVDVLRELYGKLLAPRAVFAELSHPKAPSEVRIWIAEAPSWLEFVLVDRLDPTLPTQLGAGEREAISLAQKDPASLLIIDDYAARIAAEERKIEITGTLAVVRKASLRGRLVFKEAITNLRESGFPISPRLESAILTRYEEELKLRRQ